MRRANHAGEVEPISVQIAGADPQMLAEAARHVLAVTGADAIMIGRAAQGRPWMFGEIEHFLETGERLPPPRIDEIQQVMNEHLEDQYAFYGEITGVQTARKHIGWYTRGLSGANTFRHRMNTLDTTKEQLLAMNEFFDEQKRCQTV